MAVLGECFFKPITYVLAVALSACDDNNLSARKQSICQRKSDIEAHIAVEWIEENHAEEHTLIAVTQDHRYLRVKDVWEGETDGHAIMMNVAEDAAHD